MSAEFMECAACKAKPGSPTLCEACLYNRALIDKLSGPYFTSKERENLVILAASRGVFEAITSGKTLGDAARSFKYEPRTFEGDAFETAFEWAREEQSNRDLTGGWARATCENCKRSVDGVCPTHASP